MTIDISVVIPAYNAAATIGGQLAALAAQEWPGRWEVVVADNGSTDDTAARAREFEGRLPVLRVVDASQTRGAAHARNVGAEAARGEFVAFIDADDLAQPGWLAGMARGFAESDVVAGRLAFRIDDVLIDSEPRPAPEPSGAEPPGAEQPGAERPGARGRLRSLLASRGFLDAAPGCNLGIRRSVFQEVGGFRADMRAGEDTAFCWDVQLAGHGLLRADDAVVHYVLRSESKGLARQQFVWGIGVAQLYALFRSSGAPRSSIIGALARWAYLFVASPVALFSARFRRGWVIAAAGRAGRLVGSARYRVLCP